ncbi:MarR family winged helix-turn-helix transcriptional regulator [Companilactobacillus keshanensis]|uniref:MarR family winged helix-turn-helix transcriptional regulator n=1 Tax=Companilactobacillus keshanensis TaxID=2486003 RepID=A0ABW4BRN4_9LACO|nr:MarR family transcriptional regulator [Companilactobacillus keshanensis]
MEKELIQALVTIVSFFNRTDRDKAFINEAGVNLEATSFQLFVAIGRIQPSNVSDLANILGKSHSSISRQIDKLEKSGLVVTKNATTDARIRLAYLSESGEKLKKVLDKTRINNITNALADWSDQDRKSLLVNLEHLADTLSSFEKK